MKVEKNITNFSDRQIDKLSPNYFVEKSKNLLSYLTNSLSIGEYRLMDTYISRVNARLDNKTEVVFTKREYEKLLANGNKGFRLRNDELNKHLSKLSKQQIDLDKFTEGKTTNLVNLFSNARTEITEEGELLIVLKCNPDVKFLFFDIAQKGYIKYQLRNVLLLKSVNAINLYNYLLANSYRKEWEVPIETLLKFALFMQSNDYYKNYSVLNSKILKKSVAEINEKTNLTVEYQAGKKGGKKGNLVQSVIFTIIRKDNTVFADSVEAFKAVVPTPQRNEKIEQIAKACNDNITYEQAQCLYDSAMAVNAEYIKQATGCENNDEAVAKYITDKYHQAEMYRAKNYFAYMKKLIEGDKTKMPEPVVSVVGKKSYDIDELDKINTLDDF